jgi:hypothetical protein
MKANLQFSFLVSIIPLFLSVSGCMQSNKKASEPNPPEVTAFAARKEAQARKLASQLQVDVSSDIWRYFAAAKGGDFAKAERLFEILKKRAGQYEGSKSDPAVTSEVWQPVLETELACEQLGLGEPTYAREFARNIIDSIPPGSIYFGGTDPGRGLITLLCKSQETGDPFFTVTQNALADGLYLNYLRLIYGNLIYIPDKDDSQKAFQEYLQDAQSRLKSDKLKPGEDVKIVNNRVQVSGQVAVMAVNGILAKMIFEKNQGREFFIEESFPLDWMYPHLAPHGLIMVIRRESLSTISTEEIERDRNYWSEQVKQMLGDWLKPDTSVKEVCQFADKVFARRDLNGYRGNPKYVTNTNACAMFSKLRSSIAGVYVWRANQTSDPAEKKRMVDAADFGFRQAYALCPFSPEALFRYTSLLVDQHRSPDALQIAQASLRLSPENDQVKDLVRHLQKESAERRQ